jgi:hypothetical protein
VRLVAIADQQQAPTRMNIPGKSDHAHPGKRIALTPPRGQVLDSIETCRV